MPSFRSISRNEVPLMNSRMITLMSVIVAFLFAISLWCLSSHHKGKSVKPKATLLKSPPLLGWHGLTPAGGTFVSATGGTFESDTPGTFESDTGGTFNPMLSDQDIEFGPSVREAILHNPDVERYDDSAEFTIGGRKRRCILLATLSQSYAEAVTENCCANFFDYAQAALVPLDQPDTMIPLEIVTDFYDVVGRNTDYVLSSEECLAENFSALITYGTEGRYDSMDKTVTPYETPQLIMEMHDTLRRHYAEPTIVL